MSDLKEIHWRYYLLIPIWNYPRMKIFQENLATRKLPFHEQGGKQFVIMKEGLWVSGSAIIVMEGIKVG
jgi:hypothetical protein